MFDLSTRSNPVGAPHQVLPLMAPPGDSDQRPQRGLQVSWARHQDEVQQAQRLRYQVFAQEMGARLPQKRAGLDVDLFDDYCEHLLVRDEFTQEVVGTYRLLTPAQARRAGSFYSDLEFDLVRLRSLRSRMVEVGRSCVHADYRHGGVILALWRALIQFMARNELDIMFGCASVPLGLKGAGGADAAASIWRQLKSTHLAPIELQVQPRLALPLHQLRDSLDVDPPALIKGYLRLGAKVLGPPAWDSDFNSADLPLMLKTADIPAHYRKHFAGHGR